MSNSHDAYDADKPLLMRCACGQDHAPGEHGQAAAASEEAFSHSYLEASLVKALFPVDADRLGEASIPRNRVSPVLADWYHGGGMGGKRRERGSGRRFRRWPRMTKGASENLALCRRTV